MMKKAILVGEKQADVGGRSRLRQMIYEFEDGARQGYDLYDMRASMQGSAGVLPLDDGGNVYLVEEFLPALGTWGLSLPRGGIEIGEEPEAAARRELMEEAGLACEVLEPLWNGCVIPNGSSWQVHLFVGRGVREVVREGGDEFGGVRTVKLPLEEVRQMVKDGRAPGALLGLAGVYGEAMKKVYVASRARLPERVEMWKALREKGVLITSKWIDNPYGDESHFVELWPRVVEEIKNSDGLLMYAEAEDFPFRGVLVEVGVTIGAGLPVHVVLPGVKLVGHSLHPLGAWAHHPLVKRYDSMAEALDALGYGQLSV